MKLENKIRQIFAKYEPEKVVQMIRDKDFIGIKVYFFI